MRKTIFLGAFLLAVGAFTSCSKDEPTPMDKAKENVAGTEWLGWGGYYYGDLTLTFKSGGNYRIDSSEGFFSSGTYRQSGTAIQFTQTASKGFGYSYTSGTISYGGGTLSIPMYYEWNGEYAQTIDFTLNVLD